MNLCGQGGWRRLWLQQLLEADRILVLLPSHPNVSFRARFPATHHIVSPAGYGIRIKSCEQL